MVESAELRAETNIPFIRIEPPRSWMSLGLRELWECRELLYFLVWRDLTVRYKQSIIGIGWVVIQPLVTIIVFSVIFGYFAKIPSDGLPYPVFAYAGILPWTYFATALNRCIHSVVADSHILTKVYFPRLFLPLAGTLSGLVDFAIAFVLLLGVLVWFGIPLTWYVLIAPFFLSFALLAALAVGLWLSAINVRYRDVTYAVPFLVQTWMFCSPVVYPLSIIPEQYRWLYNLNPMVGVIEGFRWALLGKASPDSSVMAVSAAVVLVILAGGLVFFKNMERNFADVV